MTRRPAPITAFDWQDYSCGFTCPHCGESLEVLNSEAEVPTDCPTCGMRYWLEARVMEEPPAVDVADVRGIWPAVEEEE